MAMTLSSSEQERLNNVYNEREKALAENNTMYEGLISQAENVKNQQNEYLAEQEKIQNQNADASLERQRISIEQQKEEAGKNKDVEENKALNDYTAYINPYGIQNERLFGAGLGNSGVSETSKLGARTAYQNRVATGNANYMKAIEQYNLTMDQAIKDNDAQKAQNALNKLQLELQNNQDYLSKVASLSEAKLKNANTIKAQYDDQYNTVYNQIMKEQQQAEEIRRYNEQLALSKSGSGGSGSKSGNTKSSKLASSGISGQYGSTTELYEWQTPLLSGKDKTWYNNTFEKHSYQEKDLIWVLDKAVQEGKLTAKGANYIYSSYGPGNPKSNSSSNKKKSSWTIGGLVTNWLGLN